MRAQEHTRRHPRKTAAGNMLVGLFVGLVIGVLVAAAVVWYIFKTPAPFSNKNQPAATSAARPPNGQNGAGAPQQPLALPGKPGDPAPQAQVSADGDKPRFDFYKILPGKEDTADKGQKTDKKSADSKSGNEKSAVLAEAMYLQTGSYQNAADADNQKARLAMMGVEAAVHQVMLQDKVWYRVRLGPFRKVEELNGMRSELAKQGIEAAVVKKE